MEFSEITEQQSGNVKSNNSNFYDNIEVKSETHDAAKNLGDTNKDEGHYEQLRLNKKQNKTKDDQSKRLKCVIYILSVMVIILYIAVIVLIIFVVMSRSPDPVDGKWTNWSDWTGCEVTCGNGTQIRTRACANPFPIYEGANCVGEMTQHYRCMKDACPVTNGGWSNWGGWSACSVTCGIGETKARSRSCTNPKPSDLGEDCNGDPFQFQQCSHSICSSKMSAFSVDYPSSYETIDGVSKLTFSHKIYQNGRDFSLSSGTYSCSIPGTYHFSVTMVKKRADPRVDLVSCVLFKSGSKLITIKVDPTDDDTDIGSAAISQSVVIHLSVADTVYLGSCSNPPSTYMERWSSFTGFLLYPDN